MSTTDKLGRKVVQFLHFKHVQSSFGFLFLEQVEKNSFEVPKNSFDLQKNSLISRWSQIDNMTSVMNCYELSNEAYLVKVTRLLDNMVELHDSPFSVSTGTGPASSVTTQRAPIYETYSGVCSRIVLYISSRISNDSKFR